MVRRFFRTLDFSLLVVILVLAGIGIVNLISATRMEGTSPLPIYVKQIYWVGIGLLVMVWASIVDYHFFERWAYVIYVGNVMLLAGLFLFGDRTSGAVRWFTLGPVSFQPSEFMKLSLLFALARYLSNTVTKEGLRLVDLVVPTFLLLVPAGLILKEPDLGSAGLLILFFVTMIFAVKMRRSTLVSLIGLGVVSVPFGVFLGWEYLKPYQRQRILTFLNPDLDPLGSGYHIIQSKIAVGSGGLIGKGYMAGTQGLLKFLPEQHTDFIFSVLAEEWGFIGAVVVAALFLFLIIKGLTAAKQAKDLFGGMAAMGISIFFLWQFFVNVGMATGIFPVVGIPLPFLSYGGSSLVVSLFAGGLLLNIHRRKMVP
jgi:rod shape determining protein RodA